LLLQSICLKVFKIMGVHIVKKKLLIILSIIFLVIGGYFVLNEYKKKRMINVTQGKAEKYVIENYEIVESVQIVTNNYHFDLNGGLSVGGNINNNDCLTFYITFIMDGNEVGELRSKKRMIIRFDIHLQNSISSSGRVYL